MGIQLRVGTLDDLHALHALDQACFRRGIAYSLAEMRFFLSRAQAVCLVAEDEPGNLAGFALAEVAVRAKCRAGHLITIDVSGDFRRRGVGQLLMEGIEARLIAQRAAIVRLEVAADNLGAQEFYAQLGYETIGRIPGYYLGKLDALVMEKLLSH